MLLTLLILACAGGADTGTADGITVTNFVQADCDGDTATTESALSAEPGASSGTVDVAHDAVSATCCVQLAAAAEAADGTIAVTYSESGEPCDCMCRYDVSYTLGNVPAGDWSISAEGDAASVSVP